MVASKPYKIKLVPINLPEEDYSNDVVEIQCYCGKLIRLNLSEEFYPKEGYLKVPCTNKHCTAKYAVSLDFATGEHHVEEIKSPLRKFMELISPPLSYG
jgi:hypothetical protein